MLKYIPYHYIKPCPHCGSKKTGRYIFVLMNNFEPEKLIARSLKNGELVKIKTCFEEVPNTPNAYCEDCGAEWVEPVYLSFISKEKQNQEIKDRGITEKQFIRMKDYKKIRKKELKEEKKQKRKTKRKRGQKNEK